MWFVPAQSSDTLLVKGNGTSVIFSNGGKHFETFRETNLSFFCMDLQCQQTFVDLGSLQTGLAVGTGRVGPPFVPSKVDEGELAVHLPFPPENDLEHGMAAR